MSWSLFLKRMLRPLSFRTVHGRHPAYHCQQGCSHWGSIPEVCEGTAILIERDNISQNIAEAIQYLYDNPQEARLMAQKAEERSWIFDKVPFSKNYFDAISEIIGNKG